STRSAPTSSNAATGVGKSHAKALTLIPLSPSAAARVSRNSVQSSTISRRLPAGESLADGGCPDDSAPLSPTGLPGEPGGVSSLDDEAGPPASSATILIIG